MRSEKSGGGAPACSGREPRSLGVATGGSGRELGRGKGEDTDLRYDYAVRIGIIGGTFDPPHIAHMAVAEAALRQLDLHRVWFVPAGIPWQKVGRSVTPARHRWAMTLAATSDVPYFEADDREIRRSGKTYTIDTLAAMEADSPFLILGADAAARLPSWHRADEVLQRARLAVAPRPGTARHSVELAVKREVEWLDVPHMDLSGTGLRRRMAEGHGIRFLVRESVREYIEIRGLYRSPPTSAD